MEIYWPFKKKIKISIEDSEAEKARKAEEARLDKEREEQNKQFIEDLTLEECKEMFGYYEQYKKLKEEFGGQPKEEAHD